MSSLWCHNDDSNCLNRTLWDSLSLEEIPTLAKKKILQRRRLGFILLHTGVWLIYRVAQLMTLRQQKEEQSLAQPSYDNNIYNTTSWQRTNFFGLMMLACLMNIFLVHASFTDIFGNNLWYFIIGFKIVGIIVENISGIFLNNGLMMGPLSATIELMGNLATFGAPDFLEFIASFVLGLGVQMGERAYVEPVLDKVVGFVTEKIEKLRDWIKRISGEVSKEEEEDSEGNNSGEDCEEGGFGEEGSELGVVGEEGREDTEGKTNENLSKKGKLLKDNPDISIEQSDCSDILLTENSFQHDAIDVFDKLERINMLQMETEFHRQNDKANHDEVGDIAKDPFM